ncbi:hypothetical protein JL720_13563 [Aureococcus anophagefferens]|nr:hypothetical protein JL720_13563 [Aureococcus anophagefferens]
MLQCPVCYCMMAPPITQCQQGHALCSSCYACVGKCPTCRVELPEAPIRSLALEQLASLRARASTRGGCGLELEYAAFAGHVACCEHRPFRCPFQRSTSRRAAARRQRRSVGDDADADMTGGDAPRRRTISRGSAPAEPPVTRPNDPSLETSEDACAWEGGVDEIVDHLVHCHGVHVERSRDVLDDGVRYLLEDAEGSGECTWGPWLARDAAGRAYLLRVQLLGERPARPAAAAGRRPRLTLWFEIVGAGDGDDASLEGTNATHADETRGARCDTDADLERASRPCTPAAREADDAAAAPKRGELA